MSEVNDFRKARKKIERGIIEERPRRQQAEYPISQVQAIRQRILKEKRAQALGL